MALVLVVEDEQEITELVVDYLHAANFQTHCMSEGTNVIDWVKKHSPDLIVLDIMLPGKDGMTICKEIRQFSDVPVIMATAKVEDIDRLLGLELGADDYLCKPYNVRELVARVKAILRRFNPEFDNSGGVKIDFNSHCITLNDNRAEVSAVELALFSLLYKKPGRIYSRAQIIEQAYSDFRVVSERTVDSHVKNLRKKLTALGAETDLVHSIYSVGYKFEY